MNRRSLILAAALSAAAAAPAAARVNMLEPWAPGLDFRIPKETWNHDVHMRAGFGQGSRDAFALGYLLYTPLSPDWLVGGGIDFLSVDGPMGDTESGLSDLSFGAKYKVPQAHLPASLEVIGEAGLTLPTGDADKGLGAGGLGFFGGGSLQGALAADVTGYAHLGLRIFLEGQDVDLGEVVEYAFGMKYRVDQEWTAAADVRGFNHARDEYMGVKGDKYQEIYLAPGAVYRPKTVPAEFLGTVLLGLSDDAYDFGLSFAAKF